MYFGEFYIFIDRRPNFTTAGNILPIKNKNMCGNAFKKHSRRGRGVHFDDNGNCCAK